MRGFLLARAGLIMASALVVRATQTPKIDEKQPGACTVSGQVVTAAEGAPLKSSRGVLIRQDASSHPPAFSATTDGDGRFEIKKVLPGRYLFFASHAGYITQQYKVRGMSIINLLAGHKRQHRTASLKRLCCLSRLSRQFPLW